MVSKASDDLPEPLGPVTTVNLPNGRSTSMPLRLFWRAPRISTQPRSAGAVTHSFSATFEPTGDYPSGGKESQAAGKSGVSPDQQKLTGGTLRHACLPLSKSLGQFFPLL